ncbi:hypothetical protein IAT38_006235 [Cryptococcus sp. DSM 104549]
MGRPETLQLSPPTPSTAAPPTSTSTESPYRWSSMPFGGPARRLSGAPQPRSALGNTPTTAAVEESPGGSPRSPVSPAFGMDETSGSGSVGEVVAQPTSPASQEAHDERTLRADGEPEGLPSYEQSLGPEVGNGDGEGEGSGGLARFGRWRGWVEKRALERFNDTDREARRAARRQIPPPEPSPVPLPPSYDSSNPTPSSSSQPPLPDPYAHLPLAARPTPLPNTSLLSLAYGSPFIPHASAPITCALPLLAGRLVLLGTEAGLRILNTDEEDAPAKGVWWGLPVWEIHILHLAPPNGGSTPRGTVLLLCGGAPDSSHPGRPKRGSGAHVRLYKLESLVSLARWSALQAKGYAGLDMSSGSGGGGGGSGGGGGGAGGLGRMGSLSGLGSFRGKGKGKGRMGSDEWTMVDRWSLNSSTNATSQASTSSPSSSPTPSGEDLPRLWAADHTYLRTPSSTTQGPSSSKPSSDCLTTAVFRNQHRIFLAVGTGTQVVVHAGIPPDPDQPGSSEGDGCRFTGARTLYLPAPPVHLAFLQLPGNDLTPDDSSSAPGGYAGAEEEDDTTSLFEYDDLPTPRSRSDTSHEPLRARSSSYSSRSSYARGAPPPLAEAGQSGSPSLGLFVSFGSRACLIRVVDSAVLDFKLRSGTGSGGGGGGGLGGLGGDGGAGKGDWGALETLVLPGGGVDGGGEGGEVYVMTRGKETFLFAAPFEIPSHFNTPLAQVLWPESPFSLSASLFSSSPSSPSSSRTTNTADAAGEDITIQLIATSFTGNLHVQQLTFSAGPGGGAGAGRAKPFGSQRVGEGARIVGVGHGGVGVGVGVGGEGGEEGGGCFVMYKKAMRDWRVVKIERAR